MSANPGIDQALGLTRTQGSVRAGWAERKTSRWSQAPGSGRITARSQGGAAGRVRPVSVHRRAAGRPDWQRELGLPQLMDTRTWPGLASPPLPVPPNRHYGRAPRVTVPGTARPPARPRALTHRGSRAAAWCAVGRCKPTRSPRAPPCCPLSVLVLVLVMTLLERRPLDWGASRVLRPPFTHSLTPRPVPSRPVPPVTSPLRHGAAGSGWTGLGVRRARIHGAMAERRAGCSESRYWLGWEDGGRDPEGVGSVYIRGGLVWGRVSV